MARMGGSGGSASLGIFKWMREMLGRNEKEVDRLKKRNKFFGRKIGKLNVRLLKDRRQRRLKEEMFRRIDYITW